LSQTERVDSGTFQEFLTKNTVAVVDFYADWCGPCRIVSPVIEKLSSEYDGKARFAKLDVDGSPEIAEKFDVASIPTVMIFKNGQLVNRIVGARPADYYRGRIEEII